MSSREQTESRSRTLISVATYNERENLPQLVEQIRHYLPDTDILVIDDASPDGTGEWVDQQAERDPHLSCMHRSGKLGLGTACLAAMSYAVDHEYAYLINMDADLSHDPKYLAELIGRMDPPMGAPHDVVIGSRYVSGGGTANWPLIRKFMSRGVNLYARWLLKLPVKDCSGGFRCYRCTLLKRLDHDQIVSTGYSFFEEILWRLKRLGGRFSETPIVFMDRRHGQSKIDSKEAMAALRIIFKLGCREWFGRKD